MTHRHEVFSKLVLCVFLVAAGAVSAGCTSEAADTIYGTQDAGAADAANSPDTGGTDMPDASADVESDLWTAGDIGSDDAGGDTEGANAGRDATGGDVGAVADAGDDAAAQPDTGTDPSPQPDAGTQPPPTPQPDAGTEPPPTPQPDAGSTPDTGTTPPPPSSTPAFLSQSNTSAMWLWADAATAQAFMDNQWGMTDDLLQFVAAPHGQSNYAINRIFFEMRTYSRSNIYDQLRPITYDPLLDATEQAKLRNFNSRMHSQGVAVEYLDGQAIWLASDANAQWPKQVCRDVVAFNQSTTKTTERLDGVHFDIEPHTVQSGPWAGDWWNNKLPNGYNADWTQRFKDITNSCRATFDAYEAQSGFHMTLSVDLGADYAYYNKPFLNFLNGPSTPVDYVALMNYYDNRPNQNGQPSFFYGWDDGAAVTGGVVQNLSLWTDVPVLFGMETGPTAIAADYMSFNQEGYLAMYSVIDTLRANYSQQGMLGFAVHPWGGYTNLQP